MEDYKKYSIEQLENWMHDVMSAGEASAEEIYNTIKKVVEEQYYHHKHYAGQAYELLALLNGNGIGHIKIDGYSVNGESHSNYWYEYDRNDPNKENPFLNKKVNRWIIPVRVDDAAGDAEPIYYINLPDDLLEVANLKEGDQVYWTDRKDGSFEIRKVTKPLGMDEC